MLNVKKKTNFKVFSMTQQRFPDCKADNQAHYNAPTSDFYCQDFKEYTILQSITTLFLVVDLYQFEVVNEAI